MKFSAKLKVSTLKSATSQSREPLADILHNSKTDKYEKNNYYNGALDAFNIISTGRL